MNDYREINYNIAFEKAYNAVLNLIEKANLKLGIDYTFDPDDEDFIRWFWAINDPDNDDKIEKLDSLGRKSVTKQSIFLYDETDELFMALMHKSVHYYYQERYGIDLITTFCIDMIWMQHVLKIIKESYEGIVVE